jgi:adenylate kinase family enzyme
MKRIAIIGCCGAGKSTFAKQLQAVTSLPLVHLDREFWNAGWREPDKEEFRSRILEIYERDSWIIDGHYHSTLDARLARSQVVFHLDYSTWTCLRRTMGRTIRNLGRDRSDCAEGCPERFDFDFLRYVATFRKNYRERTVGLLQKHSHLIVHRFRHPRELAEYLNKREQATAPNY